MKVSPWLLLGLLVVGLAVFLFRYDLEHAQSGPYITTMKFDRWTGDTRIFVYSTNYVGWSDPVARGGWVFPPNLPVAVSTNR